jgi:hypothetical protein
VSAVSGYNEFRCWHEAILIHWVRAIHDDAAETTHI